MRQSVNHHCTLLNMISSTDAQRPATRFIERIQFCSRGDNFCLSRKVRSFDVRTQIRHARLGGVE